MYEDDVLDLTIQDISTLLMMSEKEIKNHIKKKEIPFQKIQDNIYFNKQQIIEWALGRNIPLNISNDTKLNEYHIETLTNLLEPSSFFYNCDLSKEMYIDQMVELIDIETTIDKDIIVQLLKNREQLMSTAIGHGISLPHPRIPLMVGRDKPLINIFFPRNPLDLQSIDEKPVHTIILIISQTIKQHLSLLAHLGFLLSNDKLRSALEQRYPYKDLIQIIDSIESTRSE